MTPVPHYFGSITSNCLPSVRQKRCHKQSITWSLIDFSKDYCITAVNQTANSVFFVVVTSLPLNLEQDKMFRFSPGIQYTELRIIRYDPMRNGSILFWLEATLEPLESST